jgi:GNAT superfamily N-acetyltransferase
VPLKAVDLDESMIEKAGSLVAGEQAVARRTCPQLPASFESIHACTEALQPLLDAGGVGVVVTDRGRPVAVMTAKVEDSAAVGPYARLPAEGLAVDPAVGDPTAALAVAYAALAPALVARGIDRHYLLHVARRPVQDAMANLGFARQGVYALQAVAPRRPAPAVSVRVAGPDDWETVARLALVELRYRTAAPMFGQADDRQLEDLRADHRILHDGGAVHLVASVDRRDVGLLTLEPTSPVPRLCPIQQPYIGPTATLPEVRRHGVGRALVDAALNWAHGQGHGWISVDFEAANVLSRPFWLRAGFTPTGYGLLRFIDPRHRTDATTQDSRRHR